MWMEPVIMPCQRAWDKCRRHISFECNSFAQLTRYPLSFHIGLIITATEIFIFYHIRLFSMVAFKFLCRATRCPLCHHYDVNKVNTIELGIRTLELECFYLIGSLMVNTCLSTLDAVHADTSLLCPWCRLCLDGIAYN